MSIDDRYIIDTPENIEFAYDVAGIGSRFIAALVDTTLILLLQLIPALVFFLIATLLPEDVTSAVSSFLVASWALLSFVLLWSYYVVFDLLWNGQSPGKRLIGIRVVREGGRPITFVASMIRNLIRFVDFLPSFYGIGVLTMFVDKRARRLGDFAAGSLVVKERRAVSLESLTSRAEPVDIAPRPIGAPATPLLPNLNLVSEDDYDLVQDYLRRRGQLGAASRNQIGSQLADGLRARLGLPTGGNPELFLENLVREYRVSKQQNRELSIE